MSRYRVLLVGNYVPDHQQSMLRFADCVAAGLEDRDIALTRTAPPGILGRLPFGPLRKWLGYIDKFILFIPYLWWQARRYDVVHICDHSNSIYAQFTGAHTLVTCHDLLAVRGALGEVADCPASSTGKLLQHWIHAGLKRASRLAAVSDYTRQDLKRLVPRHKEVALVYNGLNYPYRVLEVDERNVRFASLPNDLGELPFALHVGSNATRKNRATVLRAVALAIGLGWPGRLVLAGTAPDLELLSLISDLGLTSRVLVLSGVSNDVLELLYNAAHALIFPSRFEGFGWPLIEAQACGCPVIASTIPPFVEIAGGAARLHPAEDAQAMAEELLALHDPVQRAALIAAGLENAKRFTAAAMIDGYLTCYAQLNPTPNPNVDTHTESGKP